MNPSSLGQTFGFRDTPKARGRTLCSSPRPRERPASRMRASLHTPTLAPLPLDQSEDSLRRGLDRRHQFVRRADVSSRPLRLCHRGLGFRVTLNPNDSPLRPVGRSNTFFSRHTARGIHDGQFDPLQLSIMNPRALFGCGGPAAPDPALSAPILAAKSCPQRTATSMGPLPSFATDMASNCVVTARALVIFRGQFWHVQTQSPCRRSLLSQ